jgi:hypothetical protein
MWQKKACQLAGKTLLGEQKIIPRIFWRNNNFKSSEDASPISNEERYITKVSNAIISCFGNAMQGYQSFQVRNI